MPEGLRRNPRNKSRTERSRFEALADLSMEDVRRFIADYEPWSAASLRATRTGHDRIDSTKGPNTPPRPLPLPSFLESDLTYTGFTVQAPEKLRRGKPPAKRFAPKDDLWPARAFAAHDLARKIKRAVYEYTRAGESRDEVIRALADNLRIAAGVVILCAVDPKAAIPDLIKAICGESIEEKALKRHHRLFLQLRPWLRKGNIRDEGNDPFWSAPQVSYFSWPWTEDYRGSEVRYFEALVHAFLKKTAPKSE